MYLASLLSAHHFARARPWQLQEENRIYSAKSGVISRAVEREIMRSKDICICQAVADGKLRNKYNSQATRRSAIAEAEGLAKFSTNTSTSHFSLLFPSCSFRVFFLPTGRLRLLLCA